MADKSVKLSELMQTGRKKSKKAFARDYKEAKAACKK